MKKNVPIPLVETGLVNDFLTDYLSQKKETAAFYQNFPNFEGFANQLKSRKNFNPNFRKTLVSVLKAQNEFLQLSEKTKLHINQLELPNTFTVTTGHQLNLFTGPLYVIYKLLTTINLAETLQKQFPENHFVPIYWMASEDHDFEEINHFWVHQQKITWDKKSAGAVGALNTDGIKEVYHPLKNLIENEPNAKNILDLFEQSYLKHSNFADANRYLINELFGKFGLVILDGNDVNLKNQFKPFLIDELMNQSCEKVVKQTNVKISKNYKVQVNPREINLFYLMDGNRQRIIFEKEKYKILNTALSFSKAAVLEEVNKSPEKFSPNVLMRPLYQEVILPNLCYIGGAGELAYWLQLKDYFNQQKVDFPILLHRNSVLLLNEKQQNQLVKLQLSYQDLLLPIQELINKKIKEISEVSVDFTKQREYLNAMFLEMESIAAKTDKSFMGAVKAQHQKQLNGLTNLEKRLLKAEKIKHQTYINQLTTFHQELFPNGILQERIENITNYLLKNENSIAALKELLNPLSMSFDVIYVD